MGVGEVAAANEEAIEAWDGPLFDRFSEFRHLVTDGLGAHGAAGLELAPPRLGDRALDIGCGFGDTTVRIAELVGPDGEALGIDAAPRFIEAAREESAGVANASFEVVDVEADVPGGPYDYAFSRFGTMFFANPVAAMRNVREAMAPGGRLCMVVWRQKLDNDWLHRAETVVEKLVEHNDDSDEPTCGPGPFSMANADTTSHILVNAGFEQVALRRCDIPITIGRDLDEAIAFNCAIGPAGELLRLAGDEAADVRPRIEADLREALADFEGADGVVAPASTWIVTASAPTAPA
jgi:SAM-dependent methyltransferase